MGGPGNYQRPHIQLKGGNNLAVGVGVLNELCDLGGSQECIQLFDCFGILSASVPCQNVRVRVIHTRFERDRVFGRNEARFKCEVSIDHR